MPTFTAIALDTLLEPGASKSVDKSVPRPVPKPRPGPNSKLEKGNSTLVTERKNNWPPITPALYATPEATPLPDSPTSFPPSPYIINHKRRGPRLLKSSSESNVLARQKLLEEQKVNGDTKDTEIKITQSTDIDFITSTNSEPIKEQRMSGCHDCGSSNGKLGNGIAEIESRNGKIGNGYEEFGNGEVEVESSNFSNGVVRVHGSSKLVPSTPEKESEREDFYDPQESMSITSSTDVEDNAEGELSAQFTTPMVEFFDAWEELSSEGGQQSALRDIEAELREMRLSLLMEIEKRKHAEEALSNMQKQWERIRQQLSLVGLTLPAESPAEGKQQPDSDSDPGEELCRQVYLARFVANSIGRGLARAELEAEMETQIEAKNFEIARLCDKLRNYEAMNQEMVQRNQDVLEMTRRERMRRERRQRWIWGSIAAALTLGAAGLAWSYYPSGTGSPTCDSEAPQSNDGAK